MCLQWEGLHGNTTTRRNVHGIACSCTYLCCSLNRMFVHFSTSCGFIMTMTPRCLHLRSTSRFFVYAPIQQNMEPEFLAASEKINICQGCTVEEKFSISPFSLSWLVAPPFPRPPFFLLPLFGPRCRGSGKEEGCPPEARCHCGKEPKHKNSNDPPVDS